MPQRTLTFNEVICCLKTRVFQSKPYPDRSRSGTIL